MKIACPRCGADVVFLPSNQKCYCDYCGSTIDISEFNLEKYQSAKNDVSDQNDVYAEFHCSSCGAQLVTDSNTVVTKCLFCGSQQMIKERLSGRFEPQEVLPFKIDKKTFTEQYAKYIKKRWLAPDEFRNNPNVIETRGLYVPFYIYIMDESIYARGQAYKRQNKQTYYKYFEMQVKDTITSPQDASTNLDDDIMTSLEPFDFNELTKFNPTYITGFLSETGNEKLEDLQVKAEQRASYSISSKVNARVKGGYTFNAGLVNIDFTNTTQKYVLLPIWFFNTWFRNKKYSYALNGQTGKIVGQIPLSKTKFATLMTILAIIAVILTIILIGASSGSSQNSDSDGPGGLIAFIWIAYATTWAAIKAKYKNVKKVRENPVITKNEQLEYMNEYSNKKKFLDKFPNDELITIKYHRTRDGSPIPDIIKEKSRNK